jgi:FAD/FMN-containing dehydrogenase
MMSSRQSGMRGKTGLSFRFVAVDTTSWKCRVRQRLIDFSKMKSVRVDAGKRRAYVEPGATLANFDEAVQAHGLATPVGINSTTGIAGLTLGGGFGWLTRKYGMTIDNLISVDMITAEGKKLRASQNENADLFWAIRGGGGNFGVVTQFEFQLFPLGPEIVAGLIVFPFNQAKQILTKYRQFVNSHPRSSMSGWYCAGASIALFRKACTARRLLPIFYSGASRKRRLILLCAPSASSRRVSASALRSMAKGF